MVLKANPATAGQFEDDVATTAVEQTVESTPVTKEAKASVGAVVATAAAKTGVAVATGPKSFGMVLQGYKEAFDPSSLDWNTFPRITASLSGFEDDKKTDLGKQIQLQLMSYNDFYVISTGAARSAESDALVKFSLDGETIDGTGQPVEEYLDYLRGEGYDKANKKKYLSLYGMLVQDSREGKLAPIDVEDQQIVHVQIPPMSVPKFTRYQITQGVKVGQGKAQETDLLILTQSKANGKTVAYAEIDFS